MTVERAAIVGRATERRRIAEFLDATADGPSALLFEGEAGIGKTTVWAAGVAAASDRAYHVLSCRPGEAEMQLGYAALADLLARVPGGIFGELPAPQQRAIDVALLRTEPEGEGSLQRAVAVATLGVVNLLALDAPVIVAVDDAQWLDQPSEIALGFAVRRLADARVGVLLARRTEPHAVLPLELERSLPASRLGRLQVEAVDRATLGRIVALHLEHTLPAALLVRLHRATAGNPFYALEVGRAIDAPDHAGELPIPASLQDVVGERLANLTEPAREAVELTAALARPTTSLLAAAMGEARASDAIEAATRAGVLESDGQRLRLAHPLLGSSAHSGMPVARRRAMHARLAEVVDEPEERAQHLALATDEPDDSVARALDEAARRAAARGAPATAAELLEHARRLTPATQADDLLRRTIEAADRHFDAGYVERACSLLDDAALTSSPGEPRARVLARLGWVRAQLDGFHVSAELFRQASAEPFEDVALRIDVEEGLAWCLPESVNVAAGLVHASRALDLAEELGDPTVLAGALSHVAFLETLQGNGVALERIDRAVAHDFARNWSQILGRPDWVHGMLLQWAGDLAAAHERFEVLYRDAVERGDEHVLPFVLFHLARIELQTGDWSAAEDHAREADQTAVESGQVSERPYSLAIMALVAAHLGRVDEALARIDEGLACYEEFGVRPAGIELLAAKGFLAVSLEDWEIGDRALEEARSRAEATGLREPALFRLHGDAIEAKLALGRVEEADDRIAELVRFAETLDRPILRAIACRCGGLLAAVRGDLASAHALLEEALVHHGGLGQPFEEARTLLALGSLQRRDRKKRATRETLGRAAQLFDGLGARLWSERARGELARVGGRPSVGELTPTEARVAELIASGRTYREAADALFISPKTVQWNLSKIYRKLGVRSRAELAARMRGADESPPAPADRPAGS